MEQAEKPSRPALPLLVLLAFASVLGVAVAIALAGITMLLAAPAYAGEGSLLLERSGRTSEAPLLYADAESQEDGSGVSTRLVQTYANPFDEPVTGVYLYRFDGNAVLERLSFTVEAAAPRPALLTRREATALVERTAEIGPGETLRVEMEYRIPGSRRALVALGAMARMEHDSPFAAGD